MIHLPTLMSEQLSMSRSEARRLIVQGGVHWPNGDVVDAIDVSDLAAGQTLRVGERLSITVSGDLADQAHALIRRAARCQSLDPGGRELVLDDACRALNVASYRV